MHPFPPQNRKYLTDLLGSRLQDGACVVDAGTVRLELGDRRSAGSAYWDAWFSVTRHRSARPVSGTLMDRRVVQLIGVLS